MISWLAREPVAIAAIIGIAINLAVSFGLRLTVDQIAMVNALAVAILAVIARNASTPVAAPKLPIGTPVLIEGAGDVPPPDAIVALKDIGN